LRAVCAAAARGSTANAVPLARLDEMNSRRRIDVPQIPPRSKQNITCGLARTDNLLHRKGGV
jgi:hypothetical protein